MNATTDTQIANETIEKLFQLDSKPLVGNTLFSDSGALILPLESEMGKLKLTPESTADIPQKPSDCPISYAENYNLSVTQAGKLKIPVVGSISGGYNRRVVVFERAAYKPIIDADLGELRYGYSIRLAITVSEWKVNGKINLPFLAASAELGQIEAAWRLQVVGLAGPLIDEYIPEPSELDVETFFIAKQSLKNLVTAINDPNTTFTAQLLAIYRPEDSQDHSYRLAAAQSYALGGLERRWTLQEALDRLNSNVVEVNDMIRDTYIAFDVPEFNAKPSKEVSSKARNLLGRVAVSPR